MVRHTVQNLDMVVRRIDPDQQSVKISVKRVGHGFDLGVW